MQAFPRRRTAARSGSPDPDCHRRGVTAAAAIGLLSVTIGATTCHVVGGFDGTTPTGRARHHRRPPFSAVATLPVPVRYAAVTAVDGKVYVFGGPGGHRRRRWSTDRYRAGGRPRRHSAVVDGHLPDPWRCGRGHPGGHVYVVGGRARCRSRPRPGSGPRRPAPRPPPIPVRARAVPSPTLTGRAPHRPFDRLGVEARARLHIWSFDPTSQHAAVAGRLQVPVSNAGVAVIGSTAWLVGGESDGTPVTAVQMLTPNAAFGVAGARGAGSPYSERSCWSPTGATTASWSWTNHPGPLDLPVGLWDPTPWASTFPTTPSSSATALPSSPTRNRTRPSSRSAIPREVTLVLRAPQALRVGTRVPRRPR